MKKIRELLEDIAWTIGHAEIDEDTKPTLALMLACLVIGINIATLIR